MNVRSLMNLNIDRDNARDITDDVFVRRERHGKQTVDPDRASRDRGDAFERAADIEHFNNYSKHGTHINMEYSRSAAQSISQETRKTVITEYPEVTANDTKDDEKPLPETNTITPSDSRETIKTYYSPTTTVYAYEVASLRDYMNSGMVDYVAGKISADEMAEIAEQVYRDILALNIQLGKTDGNDPEFNEKLLAITHLHFVNSTVNTLWFDMHDKGFEYGKETFGFTHPVSDHFSYYDAKYYYACKELQEIGDAVFSRIAKDEGLSGFNVAYPYSLEPSDTHNFNAQCAMRDQRVMVMKDVNLAPPRDFKMFFSPTRYGLEAWLNGNDYVISANDPLKHNGLSGYDCYIRVPKGWDLWKTLPFWLQQTKVDHSFASNHPRVVGAYDISKYITSGADFANSLKDFLDKHMSNFLSGALTVWHNDTMTEYDVPFNIITDDIRQFDGAQLVSSVSYAGFMSNFEFYMCRQ